MDSLIKVCHFTSVHKRFDARIFYKECISLSKNGFKVFLVVADNNGDEEKHNINIIDVGRNESRLGRILFTAYRTYKKALKINANIYHFHDPELLLYGVLLKLKGKKVIYDVHEDVPRQLLTKPYLNSFFQKIISYLFERLENKISTIFSGIICATPFITKRFKKNNQCVININNFPIVEKQEFRDYEKKYDLVYVGHISKLRGFDEMCNAIRNTNTTIALAGVFSPESLQKSVNNNHNIFYLGYLNRNQTYNLLIKSKVGLVLLHKTESYETSLPVKMFEYLLAGIPVITSNFPLWEEIIKKNDCGICVNPQSLKEIIEAINYLLKNPKIANAMGKRGRELILEKYNWDLEEKNLVVFYRNISKT